MSTDQTFEILSQSSKQTEALGESLGQRLKGGETIILRSDLGGGKTTLVRGIARGLGSQDQVASPSFMLAREYNGSKIKLYHFDFYRLNEPGIMSSELAEILNEPNVSVVVEWGDMFKEVLGKNALQIEIKRRSNSEDDREIIFNAPNDLGYLIEDIEVIK